VDERLADLSGLRILIVEDNADSLEMLETVLRSCGAVTVGARNTATALAYLGTARFDALMSDLALPDRSGLDLIRTVRAGRGPERTIPAIALTAFYEEYDQGALAAGFDAYFRKPVNLDALCATLRQLVDSRPQRH
jgi:CheY-like chemotaxis protein